MRGYRCGDVYTCKVSSFSFFTSANTWLSVCFFLFSCTRVQTPCAERRVRGKRSRKQTASSWLGTAPPTLRPSTDIDNPRVLKVGSKPNPKTSDETILGAAVTAKRNSSGRDGRGEVTSADGPLDSERERERGMRKKGKETTTGQGLQRFTTTRGHHVSGEVSVFGPVAQEGNTRTHAHTRTHTSGALGGVGTPRGIPLGAGLG